MNLTMALLVVASRKSKFREDVKNVIEFEIFKIMS